MSHFFERGRAGGFGVCGQGGGVDGVGRSGGVGVCGQGGWVGWGGLDVLWVLCGMCFWSQEQQEYTSLLLTGLLTGV